MSTVCFFYIQNCVDFINRVLNNQQRYPISNLGIIHFLWNGAVWYRRKTSLRSKWRQTVFSYELFNFIDFWTRNPMVIISRSPNLTLTLKWPTSYSFCIVTRKNVIICSWSYLETVYNIKLFWRSTYLTLTLKWSQIHSFCIITRKNVILFLLVIFRNCL